MNATEGTRSPDRDQHKTLGRHRDHEVLDLVDQARRALIGELRHTTPQHYGWLRALPPTPREAGSTAARFHLVAEGMRATEHHGEVASGAADTRRLAHLLDITSAAAALAVQWHNLHRNPSTRTPARAAVEQLRHNLEQITSQPRQ